MMMENAMSSSQGDWINEGIFGLFIIDESHDGNFHSFVEVDPDYLW